MQRTDTVYHSLAGSIARYLANELDFNLDDASEHAYGIVDDAIAPNYEVSDK